MAKKRASSKREKDLAYWLKVGGSAILVAIITGVFAVVNQLGAPFAKGWAEQRFATDTPTPTPFPTLTPTPTSTPTPTPTPCSEVSPTRYGFDCGRQLWSVVTKDESGKVIPPDGVTATQMQDRLGNLTTVMAITVDFTGDRDGRARENREKGEVQVNFNAWQPIGYPGPVDDLAGKTITANVWVPKGASGDPLHLNGFQLFLRDKESDSCYGEWMNIDPSFEGGWFRVVWKEPTQAQKEAEKDNPDKKCSLDFDINIPMILGLKIAVGGESTVVYEDTFTIYLDDVDWPIGAVTPTP